MTSQRQVEREAFFRDLDKLDEDEEDEDASESARAAAQTGIRPAAANTDSRRPLLHTTMPPPLSPASTAPDPIISSKVQNGHPRTSNKVNRPPILQRAQSDDVTSARVKKAGSKGKKQKILPPIPTDRQLFPDFRFFFIPNHDSPMVRALRINFAQQHGARWVRDWNTSITHILVEPSLPFTELAKALPEKTVPHGIPIISDEWISECYTRKTLLDIDQKRFVLKGMKSPFEVAVAGQQDAKTADQYRTTIEGPKRSTTETPSKDVDDGQLPPKEVSPTRRASVRAG